MGQWHHGKYSLFTQHWTTYTVTGTDASGCQNTDQVTVTVNALPTVSAGADQTVCFGDNVTFREVEQARILGTMGLQIILLSQQVLRLLYGKWNGRKRMSEHGSSNGNGKCTTYGKFGKIRRYVLEMM